MRRLARTAWLLLLFVLGLESAARLDDRFRWGTPITSRSTSVADLIGVDSSGGHGIPFASYRQFSINSAGMRGPEPRQARTNILVLGASETFGLYEARGKEFPRQLEDTLVRAGCDAAVMNAALPGFSLPSIAFTLNHRLRHVKADIVVLYPTPAQYLDEFLPAFRLPYAPPVSVSPIRLRVVRRIRDHVKSILPAWIQTIVRRREIDSSRRAHGAGWQYTTIPAERFTAEQADIRNFIDSATARGASVIVATHANAFAGHTPIDSTRLIAWAKFYPRAGMSLLPAIDSVTNEWILSQHGSGKVLVADVASAFRGRDPRVFFADFAHFTSVGASVAAGAIAAQVRHTKACPTSSADEQAGTR